jgi:hypothetical protein
LGRKERRCRARKVLIKLTQNLKQTGSPSLLPARKNHRVLKLSLQQSPKEANQNSESPTTEERNLFRDDEISWEFESGSIERLCDD